MASTYSSDLKLELMATGENAGTWGTKTNTNLNLIQQAVAGFEQVTLSSGGTLALAMSDATLSNARNMVIKFATATIAASTICTIPDSIEKFYIFDATGLTNPTNLTIKTASGTGFTLDAAKIYAAYSDGTNLKEISLDTLGGTIAAAQIADDAVTADKLADTSVTAGSYTVTSLTVDAQGRITAASSGTAGAALFEPLVFTTGPASGSVTPHPSATKFQAYAAGGGGGGGASNPAAPGGTGGTGAFGFYAGSCTGGTTYPYTAGGAGNGGGASMHNPGQSGGAGGASNVQNLLTVNGGNGGQGGPSGGNGNAGSAPGATINVGNGSLFNSNQDGGSGGAHGGNFSRSGQSGQQGGLWFLTDEG